MSDLLERIRYHRSRIGVRDRQLTIAGTTAAVVLIVSLVAWSTGGTDPAPPVAGVTSELAQKVAEQLEEGVDLSTLAGGDSARRGASRSEAAVSSAATPAGQGGSAEPPITDVEIKVGIAYLEDPGTANAAAGFAGIGQVDQKRAWDAMIDVINEAAPHGRKVVPVYYSFTTDDVQSKGAERLSQEMCARWTQDEKVFMVFAGAGTSDTLPSCLTKAGVTQVGSGTGFSYAETFRKFPYLIEHNGAAIDRMARFQIDQLHAAGFFSDFKANVPPYTPQPPLDGKAKIGLIRYDTPAHLAGASAMKERLAHHGLSLCDGCEFEVTYSSDNVVEQLNDASQVNSAIQGCKARDCTHMLFLGSLAGVRITIFFVDGAEKQAYRPRLGFNTLDAPVLVRDFLGESSHPQFRDSVLVTSRPGDFGQETPRFQECRSIFEDAGEAFTGSEASNKLAQIALYCDTAWYVIGTLEAAGRTLNLETWMNGVHTVPPVPAAGTFQMQTKTGRHDGAGAVRVAEWFDDCDCFKPTSGEIPV